MDMTPLIDLSFALLIFFMITFSANEGILSSIMVNLPRVVQSGAFKSGQIIVTINEKNEVFINDTRYDTGALLNEFKKRKTGLKDGTVLIRGDRKSNYDTIVKVMDILNQAGISRFTLAAVKTK
jgi:biopolymer transport protein ExbD